MTTEKLPTLHKIITDAIRERVLLLGGRMKAAESLQMNIATLNKKLKTTDFVFSRRNT